MNVQHLANLFTRRTGLAIDDLRVKTPRGLEPIQSAMAEPMTCANFFGARWGEYLGAVEGDEVFVAH